GRLGILDDTVGDELGGQRVETTVFLDELVDTEADRVDLPEGAPELVQVPLGGIAARGLLDDISPKDLFEHVHHLLTQVLALEHLASLGVDDLALLVEDLVILEDVLADLEVLRLDLPLSGSDRLADHAGLDRLIVRDAQLVHERLEARAVEQAQQVVLQGQVEAGHARVSLSSRTSTQLVVDTAGLVAFGTEHIQTAHLDDHLVLFTVGLGGLFPRVGPGLLVLFGRLERAQATGLEFLVGDELGVAPEHDVGTTAGHVGGDGDRTELAGPGDDRCLTGVVLGVEDLVFDALAFEHVREQFGLLHAGRTDQDGLTTLVAFGDVLGDRLELGVLVLVDNVLDVLTDHRLVGGDGYHTDAVGLVELRRLGLGRTGHTGELLVETEVVLERDLGQGLVLVLGLDAFLGLDGLLHALVVMACRQDTAGAIVDGEDRTVPDHGFRVSAGE